MPKRQARSPRKTVSRPTASVTAPEGGAPEAVLKAQRSASSDMERAVAHPATSEETGVHAGAGEAGVAGFLEPRTREAGAP